MILKFVEEKDVIFSSERVMDLGVIQKIVNKGSEAEIAEVSENMDKGFYYLRPSVDKGTDVAVIYKLCLVDLDNNHTYKFLEQKLTYNTTPTLPNGKRSRLDTASKWLDDVSGYVISISSEDLQRFFEM